MEERGGLILRETTRSKQHVRLSPGSYKLLPLYLVGGALVEFLGENVFRVKVDNHGRPSMFEIRGESSISISSSSEEGALTVGDSGHSILIVPADKIAGEWALPQALFYGRPPAAVGY